MEDMMEIGLFVLGILILFFFLLAMTNGVKRYTKSALVKKIAKKHKLFGMLASATALLHMIIAIIDQSFRATGLLVLVSLILTGLFGMLFYKTKQKNMYILHRIMGPITFILIILHIILNTTL
jgi:DMSO/TMAO reductase YedYZ heme-binding membrane subunit